MSWLGRLFVTGVLCMGCATAFAQSTDEGTAGSIQPSLGADAAPSVPEAAVTSENHGLPSWVSVLPPLVAIGLALAFRQVLLALVAGVWLGAFLLTDLSIVGSFARLLDDHIVGAVANRGHASILVFSLLLGGMLGLVTHNGGARGLAQWVRTERSSRRRGQVITWFLGLLVFFDDYANSLLVGSSMRPVTDRLRISREKLAFLVDATAAPVSSLALISSWIAVEVGYIEDQFVHLGIERDAYLTFIETIPYRFYPLLMLLFVAWVAWRGKDFGPMLRAERRAVEQGLLLRPGAAPASDFHDEAVPEDVVGRPWNAVVPVVVVVAVAAIGIYVDGQAKVTEAGLAPSLRTIVGEASSSAALLWASGAGCLAALLMSLASRALSLGRAVEAWLSGMRGMLLAALILVLAWALGDVCRDLHTADFLIGAIGDWLTPRWVPPAVFVLAALVSFATGTSWGTMAILFPLVIPLAHELAPGSEGILFGTVSSILAGSVWGDHCSPISDTTILSSMAASCDHMDHVRTQLPYALAVGGVSLLCAEIPVASGWYGPSAGLAVGALVMIGGFELLSRRVVRDET
ncbi:MAG: Na+/H+ antiporter NhaC family protein [Myxococcota bacterium]